MARVPYLDAKDLSPENRELLARNANIYRALANSPEALRAFGGLASFIRFKSRLDPRLRELAILHIGYLTRSPYEYSHHIEIARRFGVSDADIRALREEAEGRPSTLAPLDKAVLAATREMTEGLSLSEETFAALRDGLDSERIVDLLLVIAFYNGVVRLLAGLAIDVEDSYRKYLDEFPLPARDAAP